MVGCSLSEGINGTLAGTYPDVLAFTYALLGRDYKAKQLVQSAHAVSSSSNSCECDEQQQKEQKERQQERQEALEAFWTQSKAFFQRIGQDELLMSSPQDFKWSSSSSSSGQALFPDLNVKLVKELIGTGGVLSSIAIDETAQGYLTPAQWHDEMSLLQQQQQEDDDDNDNSDTILIDCRNTKEHQIGHFAGAVDPKTTTFSQFPKWVDDHQHLLAKKKVRMFCTGGIRCEKASAYIRRQIPSVQNVMHLQGGIHKYLEEYGGSSSSHWKGKNFVFDVRVAAGAEETRLGKDPGEVILSDVHCTAQDESYSSSAKTPKSAPTVAVADQDIVGRCVDCKRPFDQFDPHCVCTVCREPILVCPKCQDSLWEYHCAKHSHLKTCYFSNLSPFSQPELEGQLHELQQQLEEIAIGRRFRQKRKTLQKQIDRLRKRLEEYKVSEDKTDQKETKYQHRCRNCGDENCSGRCWGFFSLKRKEILEKQHAGDDTRSQRTSCSYQPKTRLPKSKKPRREQMIQDMKDLHVFMPPSAFRDAVTGIRVPPCMTRLLQCSTKAKWCGETVIRVVQNEFAELARPEVLQDVLANGLLRVSGRVVTAADASEIQLKSSDTIARVVHWHEAPVLVPEHIQVTKVALPESVIEAYGIEKNDDPFIYVCNKPSSVPVHQAGPYFANCMTIMVEAQENLEPQSLNPVHRTDRATSGLTLCTTNTSLSRLLHKHLSEGRVQKLYIARVKGKFPGSLPEAAMREVEGGNRTWSKDKKVLHVDAPIHTVDPANGIRTVAPEGKTAQSLFNLLDYDQETDTSTLLCSPLTGRNHQLRVHLQWLGFPIVGDVQYGGAPADSNTRIIGHEQTVIEFMLKRTSTDDNSALNDCKLSCLSEADVAAAKRACPCCTGGRSGITGSFTEAQLLKDGHAIQLHALRYRIRVAIKSKKPKEKFQQTLQNQQLPDTAVSEEPLALVDFSVDLPDWATSQINEKDLFWLSY